MKSKDQQFDDVIAAFRLPPHEGAKRESRADLCRRIYEAGLLTAPLIPPKVTRRGKVDDGHKPRLSPLFDHLAAKFSDVGFAWKAFSQTGPNRVGKPMTKHGVRFTNRPKLNGRELSTWELLVIPVELIDQAPLTGGGGWELDADDASRATPMPSGGHVFDHRAGMAAQSPCTTPLTTPRQDLPRSGWDSTSD